MATTSAFRVELTPSLFYYTIPVVGLATYVVWTVYVAFLGRNSHVPGPLLCKLTGFVDMYQTLLGARRSDWIHNVHKKYGPVVRISPNLISVNDPQSLKVVYSGKFPKSDPRYFGKHMAGTDHMLVMNTFEKFRARRNILLPLFQRSNLEAFEPDLQHFTGIFLDQVEKESKTEGSADLFRWYRLVAFDIICQLAYGVDMRMTQVGKANKLVELMEKVYVYFTLKDFIPGIRHLADSGIFSKLKEISMAEKKFVDYGEKVYTDGLDEGRFHDEDTAKTNLLDSLHRASKSDTSITRRHVATEAGAIMIAGSDTTSTAMTYASWELARRPELQKKLREELKTVAEDTVSWPTGKALEGLPLFNGFLKEILRLWPTLPGPLERCVPDGGAQLCGVPLSAGTEVTMQAYDIHRNASIFKDPLELKAERWLNPTSEMNNAFIPFSYGPRNCVGMNLAWIEIRTIIGALIRRYEITLDSKTTEESMAPVEHFFVVPKAMECRLKLRKLDH